ncbi:putative L-ascorbate peroxidase 6 isoform X5 [Ananas comosus]|uniref:L-ascorbate peroxidase 6 isoform X5 n=1 Tax=Ananas comosus TaxID=4615 RepID=A0A6P5G6X3_ANACO|nr:putative L-ascorbate peroxidase 6 isoform X5 [Ananas comosus]
MAPPSFSFCSSLLPSCVSIRCFSLRALPHLPLPSNSRRSRRRRLGRSSSSPPGGSSFRPAANSRLPLSDDSSNGISYQIVGSGRCSESSARRSFISLGTLAILLPHLQVALGVEHDEASAIRNGLRSVLSKGKAAGMLRLAFHDAGTFDIDGNSGGMNGSIIYELERPENAGLNKSVKILEKTRREIENIRHVSWADLIAVAGAEAVSLCGGPAIPIRLGRIDARSSGEASPGITRCLRLKELLSEERILGTRVGCTIRSAHAWRQGLWKPCCFRQRLLQNTSRETLELKYWNVEHDRVTIGSCAC